MSTEVYRLLPSYEEAPSGQKLAYGRRWWPSYSVWIIPGTIDVSA